MRVGTTRGRAKQSFEGQRHMGRAVGGEGAYQGDEYLRIELHVLAQVDDAAHHLPAKSASSLAAWRAARPLAPTMPAAIGAGTAPPAHRISCRRGAEGRQAPSAALLRLKSAAWRQPPPKCWRVEQHRLARTHAPPLESGLAKILAAALRAPEQKCAVAARAPPGSPALFARLCRQLSSMTDPSGDGGGRRTRASPLGRRASAPARAAVSPGVRGRTRPARSRGTISAVRSWE